MPLQHGFRKTDDSVVSSPVGAILAQLVVIAAALGLAIWALASWADRLGAFAVFSLGLSFVLVAGLGMAVVIRRALAPLLTITQWARAASGESSVHRLELPPGDAWRPLAEALDRVGERLEAAHLRARKLAFVDPVTELPNAEHMNRLIGETLATLAGQEKVGAVAVIALDRLGRLADTMGPEAAHELLAIAGQRLTSAVRTIDRMVRTAECMAQPSTPARLPGNEFAVLIPSLASPSDAARFVQLVTAALSQPVDWRGHTVEFGCTSGVALLPQSASAPDHVLRNARLAVAAARHDGRTLRFFTASLDRDVQAKLNMERAMREGLERNEFKAFFQPKINLATGRIEACEALARWVRNDQIVAGPGRFIPLAEENGLIDAIAEAILRDSCWKAAAWAREGRRVAVAVNVSALQFQDDRFATKILRLIEQADLAPELLELEVTESVAMHNVDRVLNLVEPLRERGVRFAIDDFGTGHSSLGVLSRLPFDVLKIDQSFVRGLSQDKYAPAIVETILGMAASLDFETVAEGVETDVEAGFLRLRGCSYAQGFLYGAAVPPAEFLERLRSEPAYALPARALHARGAGAAA